MGASSSPRHHPPFHCPHHCPPLPRTPWAPARRAAQPTRHLQTHKQSPPLGSPLQLMQGTRVPVPSARRAAQPALHLQTNKQSPPLGSPLVLPFPPPQQPWLPEYSQERSPAQLKGTSAGLIVHADVLRAMEALVPPPPPTSTRNRRRVVACTGAEKIEKVHAICVAASICSWCWCVHFGESFCWLSWCLRAGRRRLFAVEGTAAARVS